MNLVNGKLRVSFKLDNFRLAPPEKYILSYYKEPLNFKHKLHLNTSSDLENHWLAGFLDADGSFQIKTLSRVNPNGSKSFELRASSFELRQCGDSIICTN